MDLDLPAPRERRPLLQHVHAQARGSTRLREGEGEFA